MLDYNFLIGKSVNEVEAYAASAGLTTRIVSDDGFPVMLTCDYRTDRLNLTVDHGVVTEIGIG